MGDTEEVKVIYPAWDFDPVPQALAPFNQPFEAMLTHAKSTMAFPHLLGGLATSALIFSPDRSHGTKILLLQRAPHDSMPNKWEPPGGAADPTDASILHAAARELFEEAGLVATQAIRVVGDGDDIDGDWGTTGMVFMNRSGTRMFMKFCFEMEVKEPAEVKLDAKEHQDWVWASEEEIEKGFMANGKEIPITTMGQKRVLLNAFRVRRDEMQKTAKPTT